MQHVPAGTAPESGSYGTMLSLRLPLQSVAESVPSELAPHLEGAAFAIWTTTPWTIPANLAVAVNDQLDYCLVQAQVGCRAVAGEPGSARSWHHACAVALMRAWTVVAAQLLHVLG